MARTPINHTIFWKSVMRTFRCIYINCFNRFRFLAKVSSKLWKCTFLENWRTITQERNMNKWPYFLHLLFPLQLFVAFMFGFENVQNSFSCGPRFGPFWSVKYLNFEQKLPIRTIHHNFLESRHTEVTKYPYYILSPEWSQKRYQLMDYRAIWKFYSCGWYQCRTKWCLHEKFLSDLRLQKYCQR